MRPCRPSLPSIGRRTNWPTPRSVRPLSIFQAWWIPATPWRLVAGWTSGGHSEEQYPDLYSHHNRLLDEQRAAHAAVVESLIGDEDEATGEVCGPELGARDAFAETVPTTLPGLLAMIIYGGNIVEQDAEAFADSNCPFIQTLATAAKAIAQVQS
jgi:hypothetical protein